MIDLRKVKSKQKFAEREKSKNKINKTFEFNRLPPGQVKLKEGQFLTLDLGYRPEFNPDEYKFRVTGLVKNPINISWKELLNKFPKVSLKSDFHCVTKWSQFDVSWSGFLYRDLEKLVKPLKTAKFLIQYGLDGYTTNVPLEDLRKENVILAYEKDGEFLKTERGAPLRTIIPNLYGWKGSKFLTRLDFTEEDIPGFWEVRGYHNHGDPWKEERYS